MMIVPQGRSLADRQRRQARSGSGARRAQRAAQHHDQAGWSGDISQGLGRQFGIFRTQSTINSRLTKRQTPSCRTKLVLGSGCPYPSAPVLPSAEFSMCIATQ